MKNLLFTAAFILSCIIQLQASNTPNASNLMVVQNEKSMILNTPSYNSGTEVLSIIDGFGQIIFTDVIESNKKRIKYDLKALSNASYTIRVANSNVTNIYETEVFNDKIEILKTKTYHKPTIDNLDGKVVVRAELENKEDIRIAIYDNKNELVFQQNIEEEQSFVQSFNLNQLPSGQYEVLVSSEYFTERISITL